MLEHFVQQNNARLNALFANSHRFDDLVAFGFGGCLRRQLETDAAEVIEFRRCLLSLTLGLQHKLLDGRHACIAIVLGELDVLLQHRNLLAELLVEQLLS